jgi:hypothetical protein
MTKHFSPRRVAKPGAPGLKTLLTTTSIAATLGGWALFAAHDASTDTLPAQYAVEVPISRQAFAVNIPALSTIEPLPTLIPPPPNMAAIGIAAPVNQPTQVPTAVPHNTQPAPSAPGQSLRTVHPPPVTSRKVAPLTTTRSSR